MDLSKILIICLLMFVSQSIIADTHCQRAISAFKSGDYQTAYNVFRNVDEDSCLKSAYYLGLMHLHGYGVTSDKVEAAYWYRRGAELGDMDSQHYLGDMHSKGEGVAQDVDKAFYWYSKAAEQGKAISQIQLAYLYKTGQGTIKNLQKAAYWYKNAAEQGHPIAQTHLAELYYVGLGVSPDYDEAIYWFTRAAGQDEALAQYYLGNMYELGTGTEINNAKSFKYYRKSAEQGNAHAQYSLGNMYQSGRGITRDDSQALFWYRKAAEQGNEKAQYKLVDLHSTDSIVDENLLFTHTNNLKELYDNRGDKKFLLFFDTMTDGMRVYSKKTISTILGNESLLKYISDNFIIIQILINDSTTSMIDLQGNLATHKELSNNYRVRAIPVMILFDDGRISRYTGYPADDTALLFEFWYKEKYKETSFSRYERANRQK